MTNQPSSVALIMGSTRNPRVCPQIAEYIQSTIRSEQHIELSIIDLQHWNLPMYDEPGIPQQIEDHNEYKHEHTRAWSVEVQKHDAFIFLSPQYNWGYPAALKNAIDYLFNEWKSKPAMIVTYGGHGGSKCNAQLRQVLSGLDMQVVTSVELSFPSKDVLVKAATGQPIGVNAGLWSTERAAISFAFSELSKLLNISKM